MLRDGLDKTNNNALEYALLESLLEHLGVLE
jgi:hypothetical protein